MNSTALKRRRLAAAVLAFALIPAGTADAATKHRKPKAKKAVATKVATAKVALAPVRGRRDARSRRTARRADGHLGDQHRRLRLLQPHLRRGRRGLCPRLSPPRLPATSRPPVTSISVNTTVGGNA